MAPLGVYPLTALSSALRCVILENTEVAWLKLFMDLARSRVKSACSTSINQCTKAIDQAVSLGRSGMWGESLPHLAI